jgi:hypothetical protein
MKDPALHVVSTVWKTHAHVSAQMLISHVSLVYFQVFIQSLTPFLPLLINITLSSNVYLSGGSVQSPAKYAV